MSKKTSAKLNVSSSKSSKNSNSDMENLGSAVMTFGKSNNNNGNTSSHQSLPMREEYHKGK